MKEKLFIDTGVFFARLYQKDQNHEAATKTWLTIINDYQIVSSNYIFEETITLVRKKIGIRESIEFANQLLQSKNIQIYEIDSNQRKKAFDIFKKYDDKDFSFTDCTSFTFMQELNIKKAFSFDKHFSQMGFTLINA